MRSLSEGNACTCKNGVAPIGIECPVNGAAKCLSCNTGWTINRDKTACTCTCLHKVANKTHTVLIPGYPAFCSQYVHMFERHSASWR